MDRVAPRSKEGGERKERLLVNLLQHETFAQPAQQRHAFGRIQREAAGDRAAQARSASVIAGFTQSPPPRIGVRGQRDSIPNAPLQP